MTRHFIRMGEVLKRTSLSKTHLYRLIKAGEFPTQISLSPYRIAFDETEINEWMAQRSALRAGCVITEEGASDE